MFDQILFVVIGAYCFFCSLFVAKFAELHISLPFLDFPVFIGEMLLGVGMLLFAFKVWKGKVSSKVTFLLAAYFCWVLIKAFWGYFSFGPLAFRNAALFYYPFFGVIGYYIFHRRFFREWTRILIISIFIIALRFFEVNTNYLLPYAFLYLILAIGIRNKYLRYCAFFAGILSFPFQGLIHNSKTAVVGNITAGTFFLLGWAVVLRVRRVYKLAGLAAFAVLLAGVFFFFGNKNQISSLATPRTLLGNFKVEDRYIAARKKYYKPHEYSVGLYNPEKVSIETSIYGQAGVKNSGEIDPVLAAQIVGWVRDEITWRFKTGRYSGDKQQEIVAGFNAAAEAIKKGGTCQEIVYNLFLYEELALSPEKIKENEGRALSFEEFQAAAETHKSARETAMAEARKAILFYESRYKESLGMRPVYVERSNMLFRLFIWRDMLEEFLRERPFFGFNFGRPQRSVSIEILSMGEGEWTRDGWIAPHNSYLNLVYRGGVIGFCLIIALAAVLIYMAKGFLNLKSITGVSLVAILIYWIVLANFLVILELPYQAIPFWSLLGMSLSYLRGKEGGS